MLFIVCHINVSSFCISLQIHSARAMRSESSSLLHFNIRQINEDGSEDATSLGRGQHGWEVFQVSNIYFQAPPLCEQPLQIPFVVCHLLFNFCLIHSCRVVVRKFSSISHVEVWQSLELRSLVDRKAFQSYFDRKLSKSGGRLKECYITKQKATLLTQAVLLWEKLVNIRLREWYIRMLNYWVEDNKCRLIFLTASLSQKVLGHPTYFDQDTVKLRAKKRFSTAAWNGYYCLCIII